jgi:hypothetical protein
MQRCQVILGKLIETRLIHTRGIERVLISTLPDYGAMLKRGYIGRRTLGAIAGVLEAPRRGRGSEILFGSEQAAPIEAAVSFCLAPLLVDGHTDLFLNSFSPKFHSN